MFNNSGIDCNNVRPTTGLYIMRSRTTRKRTYTEV